MKEIINHINNITDISKKFNKNSAIEGIYKYYTSLKESEKNDFIMALIVMVTDFIKNYDKSPGLKDKKAENIIHE